MNNIILTFSLTTKNPFIFIFFSGSSF